MSLSDSTISALQDVLTSLVEWKDKKLAQIDDQAEFLASVDVSISALSDTSSEEATDSAQSIIDEVLA